jgi:hypothetical protein
VPNSVAVKEAPRRISANQCQGNERLGPASALNRYGKLMPVSPSMLRRFMLPASVTRRSNVRPRP